MLKISFQSALTSLSAYEEFHNGLRKAYEVFDVAGALSVPAPTDGTFLVMARDSNGIMQGGCRLHEQSPDNLALMHTLSERPTLRSAALSKLHPGVIEARALWSTEKYRRSGLGVALMQAVMAAAPLLGASSLVLISHQYLRRFYADLGFHTDDEIGDFEYPDERYISNVYWCAPEGLPGVANSTREAILEMRSTLAAGRDFIFVGAKKTTPRKATIAANASA